MEYVICNHHELVKLVQILPSHFSGTSQTGTFTTGTFLVTKATLSFLVALDSVLNGLNLVAIKVLLMNFNMIWMLDEVVSVAVPETFFVC